MFEPILRKAKVYWRTTLRAFVHFRNNQPLLLASSTAFFTTFSLPPITILVVNLLSFVFFQSDQVREDLFRQLRLTFGEVTAEQINEIANNFRSMAENTIYAVLGTVFLAFVATTLFYVVQTAIHQIWSIRFNQQHRLKHRLLQRGMALLMILVGGILMLLTLLAETTLSFIGDYVGEMYPQLNEVLIVILGSIVTLLIYSLWFMLLFRYLPDARIPFRIAWRGGLFTGILFSLGKYVLGLLLVTDRMGNLFGASASIMVLLLFIFYSSMIVYFGASFTYVLLKAKDRSMRTKKYTEHAPG